MQAILQPFCFQKDNVSQEPPRLPEGAAVRGATNDDIESEMNAEEDQH